jgi:hypothetical protein
VDDTPNQRWRLRLALAGGVVLLILGGVVIERSGTDAGPDDLGNLWDVVGGLIAGAGILMIIISAYLLRPSWFADRRARSDAPDDDRS